MELDDVAVKSQAIHARLLTVPEFAVAGTILSYVSSKDNEVDTKALIERLLARGKKVLVPATQADHEMIWCELYSLDELAPSTFGILEPRQECRRPAPPPDHAVVVVPGIAFARNGHRLGYGGGYFDRFLAGFKGFKIGLAYDCQVLERLPADELDVPLNMVVTETQTIRPRLDSAWS